MGTMRRVGAVLLSVGALGALSARAASAVSPPCRMTPHEFRLVRVGNEVRQGMTRAFVKQMIGCGGKVVMYQDLGGSFTIREVQYKRTAPAGSTADILYMNDRVLGKSWFAAGGAPGEQPPPPLPLPPPTVVPG
jgi:hypothetical protein